MRGAFLELRHFEISTSLGILIHTLYIKLYGFKLHRLLGRKIIFVFNKFLFNILNAIKLEIFLPEYFDNRPGFEWKYLRRVARSNNRCFVFGYLNDQFKMRCLSDNFLKITRRDLQLGTKSR